MHPRGCEKQPEVLAKIDKELKSIYIYCCISLNIAIISLFNDLSLSHVSLLHSSLSFTKVISRGTEERTQGMSGVNPLSSRSHALLQIQLRDTNQQIAGR